MSTDQILIAFDTTNMDTLSYLFKEDKYPGNLPLRPWNNRNMTRKNGKKVFNNGSSQNISKWDMEDIFKQKPNRTIFGVIKFHLAIYSMIDPEKLDKKVKKRYAKLIRKNEKRRTKDVYRNQKRLLNGKSPKELRPLKKYKPTLKERIISGIGEAPVILDSTKIQTTTQQLNTYMIKKGYFNATVVDTIIVHPRKPKAAVYYIVKEKTPYRIRTITRDIDDEDIAKYTGYALKNDSILKINQIFDVANLQKERNKIETYLLNRGYYAFSKDYIYYEVDSMTVPSKKDSTVLERWVDLTMGVLNVQTPVTRDSVVEKKHQKYFINDVTLFSDYTLQRGVDLRNYDTTNYVTSDGHLIKMAFIDKFKIRQSVLAERIFIFPGYTYRAKEVEATYTQLTDLGVFRSVSVKFTKVPGDTVGNLLNCIISLNHSTRQAFTAEADGLNRAGNLGIEGSISYDHKNLFRGAQKLNLSFTGGLEVQQLYTNQDGSVIGEGGLNPLRTFNTIEFGPTMSMKFPKAILIERFFKKWQHTDTDVGASLNFQQRPDFTRTIQEAKIKWDLAKNRHYLGIGLWSLSAIKITNQSQEFIDRLIELNDPILDISFSDQIISAFSLTYTRNTQQINKLKDVGYYSGNVELAGFGLRRLAGPLNLYYNPVTDAYELFGIRFAEYFRTSHDIRFYQKFNSKSEMVYRFAGGIGIPFENLKDAMPFARAFFAGGSNSIRAWQARLLGPGSHADENFEERFDKIGDFHLEGNIEYRFDLFDFIEGAFFLDAGNIWLLHNSVSRPDGTLDTDFYKEIAFGGGMGFRFDLDFFIVRLDLAGKLKNPILPEGERWFFQDKPIHNAERKALGLSDYRSGINVNFGIGYPF